jgi:cobalamin synthase
MVLETLLALAGAVACYAGFALIALNQERHWEDVSGQARDALKARHGPWVGGALLALALALSIGSQGPSFGALLWATMLMAAAFAVALTLSWCPRALKPLSDRLLG